MVNVSRKLLVALSAAVMFFAVSAAQAGDNKFIDSDDAKQKDEPQKFLPDYDKLVKGKDSDWVYFPDGSLSKYNWFRWQNKGSERHGVGRYRWIQSCGAEGK